MDPGLGLHRRACRREPAWARDDPGDGPRAGPL